MQILMILKIGLGGGSQGLGQTISETTLVAVNLWIGDMAEFWN